MVPMQELILGPKRLSQRERDLEVERYTRSYKNASDKKAVGFLADIKIDIRERQEAVSRLNKFRVKNDYGSLGEFNWESGDTNASDMKLSFCQSVNTIEGPPGQIPKGS